MMRPLGRTIAAIAVCAMAVTSAAGAGLQTDPTQTGATQAPDLQGKLYKSAFSTGVGALKYRGPPDRTGGAAQPAGSLPVAARSVQVRLQVRG